ncbi:MAG: molybdopterin-dependent oxidoreductase [Acidobacteriaceae bacterium]|nr:molybdopterin-dependent oxidoreductase [Acidobacteriaceae bacterium]
MLTVSLTMLVGAPSLLGGGRENAAAVTIQVNGKPAVMLTEQDFAKMPRHTVTAKEHGTEVSYGGVLLHDVLERAGAPFGSQLHGKALSSYVLATARDGYAVVYTLTEMDPDFTDSEIIVADQQNGKPLTDQQGPLRIVVPHDKKPARDLRMLDRIEIVQLRK